MRKPKPINYDTTITFRCGSELLKKFKEAIYPMEFSAYIRQHMQNILQKGLLTNE